MMFHLFHFPLLSTVIWKVPSPTFFNREKLWANHCLGSLEKVPLKEDKGF